MALPVTITGISIGTACVGPFQSSGGNYYVLGISSADTTKLQIQKASDPTTSFSAVGTDHAVTGFNIGSLSAYAVGDVINVVIGAAGVGYVYQTFDMSTDSWVLAETIATGLTTTGQAGSAQIAASVVVRSTGEVVAFFNGAQTKTGGTNRARVYYSRRTGVNTWAAAIEVDGSTAIDSVEPEAILGTSDAVHFLWRDGLLSSGNTISQRTLSSANVLQTVGNFGAVFGAKEVQGISYLNAGTLKVVAGTTDSTTTGIESLFFNSGNTPTLNKSSVNTTSINNAMSRVFNDGTTVYMVALDASSSPDLFVYSSTDDGSTWGAGTDIFVGITSSKNNLSIDGNIYTRGSSVVIPYVVNDNGTLKYNEYVVRTISTSAPFSLEDWNFAKSFQVPRPEPTQALNINIFTNPIPFVSTDRPRVVPVPLVGPPQSMPLNINTFTNPIPFAQFDWPITHRIAPPPPQPQTRDVKIYSGVPFFQGDWTKPFIKQFLPAAQPYNLALLAVLVQNPFLPVDWSISKTLVSAPPQAQALNINLFTNPLPFNQSDWSKPFRVPLVGPPQSLPNNINLFTNPIPFSLADFSTPARPRLTPPDQVNYNLALLGVQVTAPFYQIDWSRGQSVPDFQIPTAPPNIPMLVLLSTPFVQLDWAKVAIPRYASTNPAPSNINLFTNPIPFSLQDFGQVKSISSMPSWQPSFNINLSATVTAQPFAQFDWSVTIRQKTTQPGQVSRNANLFSEVPFSQAEWPKTTSRLPAPNVMATSNNVNLFSEVPFVQVDWPRTTSRLPTPNALATSNNINLLTNPFPFSQLDWNQPKQAPNWQGAKSSDFNPNLTTIPVPPPFVPIDWSKPFRVAGLPPGSGPLNINLFTNPFPVGGIGLSSSLRFPSVGKDQVYPNLPMLYAMPFFPVDLSVAQKPAPAKPDQVYLNLPMLYAMPFTPFDWSIVQKPAPAKPDQVYLNLPLLYALPFIPVDYSQSYRIRSAPFQPQSFSSLNLSLFIQPFSQTQWPALVRVNRPVQSNQGLNINLVSFVAPQAPFAQYSWPLAQRIRPSQQLAQPYVVRHEFASNRIAFASSELRVATPAFENRIVMASVESRAPEAEEESRIAEANKENRVANAPKEDI